MTAMTIADLCRAGDVVVDGPAAPCQAVIESVAMIVNGAARRCLPTTAVIAAFLEASMKKSRAGIGFSRSGCDRYSALTVGTVMIAHNGI